MAVNIDKNFFKVIKELEEQNETPFLVINKEIVKEKFKQMKEGFPFAKIFYAVKACPNNNIISLLNDLGSNFDIASVYELRQLKSLGIDPSKISYGNTIKKAQHIREAREYGVDLFATDSEADLRHLAKAAPGARVFIRILVDESTSAEWPLSRKFGCHGDMVCDLLILAKNLGLVPYGLSFHVGSQQRDIASWDAALAKVKYIWDWVLQKNIKLKMINLGGGFPAYNYKTRTNDFSLYASEITRYLKEDYEEDLPEIFIEPGRFLTADAGVLVSEVVLISRKDSTSLSRWVYLDVGKFNGLIETLDESIKYNLYTERKGEVEEVILAGPTCDSMDILYEHHKYSLPLNLAIGDKIYWLSTGAYTGSYSSVDFNGFPPLKVLVY